MYIAWEVRNLGYLQFIQLSNDHERITDMKLALFQRKNKYSNREYYIWNHRWLPLSPINKKQLESFFIVGVSSAMLKHTNKNDYKLPQMWAPILLSSKKDYDHHVLWEDMEENTERENKDLQTRWRIKPWKLMGWKRALPGSSHGSQICKSISTKVPFKTSSFVIFL